MSINSGKWARDHYSPPNRPVQIGSEGKSLYDKRYDRIFRKSFWSKVGEFIKFFISSMTIKF